MNKERNSNIELLSIISIVMKTVEKNLYLR